MNKLGWQCRALHNWNGVIVPNKHVVIPVYDGQSLASGLHLVHVSKSKTHEQYTSGGQMHSPKRQGQNVDVRLLRRLQLRAKLNASCLFLNVNRITSATP